MTDPDMALGRNRRWHTGPYLYEHAQFSDVISDLRDSDKETVSVDDILRAFGERAFAALMLFFAAPNALPLPPGSSAILGLPLVFVTAQMMLGRPTLWLPKAILRRSVGRAEFRASTNRLMPWLHRLERVLKPRLSAFLWKGSERVIGGVCLVLASVLFLPIPFGNMLPALAVSLFAVGLLGRDGLFIIAGWLATIASVLTLAVVSAALLAAANAFIDYFRNFFQA